MTNSKDYSFLPPRILTHGRIFLLALMPFLFVGSFAQAETYNDGDTLPDSITSSVIFNFNEPYTYSGTISGASTTVTKTGAGTLTLSANNSYSGGTTITAGTLKLTDGGTLGAGNVTNNANLEIGIDAGMDFSKAVSGDGSLTKTGTGVLRYSGAGTYSGGTIISEGAIRWDAGGELGTGPITLATAGSDLRFSGGLTKTIYNDIFGPGKLTKQGASGSPTVTLEGNLSGFTGTLITNELNGNRSATIKLKGNNTNLVNANEVINNGTIDVSEYTGSTTMQLNKLSGAGNVKIGSNAIILNNAANANTTFSGIISGSGAVTKTGAGTLTLSGANTYTGATTVYDGTLFVPSGATLSTSQVTVESGATFQTGVSLASTPVVVDGGTFVVGATSASKIISVFSLSLNGGTICLDLNDSSNDDADWLVASSASLKSGIIDLTFNNNSETAWWNLIKTQGEGYSIINGNINSFENMQVYVNGAPTASWKLYANLSNVMLIAVDAPSDPWYYANTNDINANSWTIDGTNKQGVQFKEGSVHSQIFVNPVHISAAGSFDIGSGYDLTISGVVDGSGAVTKTGAGTLTLSANNTYSGGTTITAGTFKLTGDGTLGSGDVTIGENGTLEFASDSNQNVSNAISGAGNVVKSGEGTLRLTQAPGYTGSTTIESGTLTLSEGGTLFNLSGGSVDESGQIAIPATLTVNGVLTLDNSKDTNYVGSIKAGSVVKTGEGTLNLFADEANKIEIGSLSVSAGDLNFKGYYEGNLEVINGAFFSPGNSIGEANITGSVAFITDTADSKGFAYFEFGDFTGADENHDLLVLGTGSLFTATDGVVLLDFANDDATDWASAGVDYLLVANGSFEDGKSYSSWLSPTLTDLFGLEGRRDGLYLTAASAPEPGSGVPEPSTWALMILGAAGLLYVRKRSK